MAGYFETKIEFLKGIGPQKATLLNKELSIFSYGDLIQHYPFRYEDRTQFHTINTVQEDQAFVQIKGKINQIETLGEGSKKRLVAYFEDATGDEIELIWFRSITWIAKTLRSGVEYIAFGRPTWFNNSFNLVHPEIEIFSPQAEKSGTLQPVYSSTEKLKNFGLDSKGISKVIRQLLTQSRTNIKETLTEQTIKAKSLIDKANALEGIHFPKNDQDLNQATFRLKFEELFYTQLKILQLRTNRKIEHHGLVFKQIPLVNEFYKNHLPFELTNAQKRVIREIYTDLGTGKQMNRLLQGDVGSGKTIVAFIIMLMAIDHGAQACLMAPTEILAGQHYTGLKEYADKLNLSI